MGAIYLGALIIGLGILLMQVAFSSGKGGGVDKDIPIDADGDHGDGEVHSAGIGALFLSFRFWTFAMAGFGLVGTPLTFAQLASVPATFAAALLVGLSCGLGASWTFRTLQNKTVNSGADAREIVGQVGKVLVPPNTAGRSKVRLLVKGQMIDYVATSDDPALEMGASVLVEEVRGNQVHVSPAPSGLKYSDE